MRNFLNYILAGYPLLWIETFEEYRAMIQLCAEMQDSKSEYSIFSWDRADGINKLVLKDGILNKGKVDSDAPLNDPMVALNWMEHEIKETGIFFLMDFHHYLKKDVITRKIRNMLGVFKATGRTMVIVSPVVDLPTEIEKEVTVIPFKLPVREDLRIVLKGLCQSAEIDYPKEDEALLDAAMGMTSLEAENAFSVSLMEKKGFDPRVIRREKSAIVKKTGLLEVVDSPYGLDDIGGLEVLKDWLRARKDCFSEEARKFGITPPKGTLLVGVPGCGKSLTAKCVAKAWERPLLRLDVGKVFGSYVGESENNIRRCLHIAEAISPVVLWIDELEKSFSGSKGNGDGHETTKRVFATFLNWLQEKTADVFIMATANSVDALPPELLRGGRFDCLFWVDLPDEIQREEILRIHLSHVGRDPDTFKKDMPKLVKACEGFSGAEIEVWVKEALVHAFSQNKELAPADLLAVDQEVTPVARLMADDIKCAREWAKNRGAKWASKVHESKTPTQTGRRIAL